MNTVVFIKAVPDNVRLKWDASGPVASDWIINPLDEYALEAALQLKTQTGGRLTVISMTDRTEHLKKAIALGADAVLQVMPCGAFDHKTRAKALAAGAKAVAPDATVWLCGQQSLDVMGGVTGPLLAAGEGWPWVGNVKALSLVDNALMLTCDEQVAEWDMLATGPVVASFIKGNAELRTPNIKGVMAANRAQIPMKTIEDLGVAMPDTVQAVTQQPRVAKSAGRIVQPSTPQEAANELLAYLKQEGFR